MGQKTDARIFRQGVIKKNWELKYVEKTDEESSLYLYKTLEIQNYLARFFELYKIKVHNCKIFYSDNSLQIFVSFYITTKTIFFIHKKLTKKSNYIKLKRSNKKYAKKLRKFLIRYKFNKQNKTKRKFNYKLNIFQKTQTKKNFLITKLNSNWIGLKGFQEILLESLATYTKNRINIFVTLQNLNRYKQLSHVHLIRLKIIFKQLKKFIKNSFFKEAINILFISISKRKSAKLLSEFISYQFKFNQFKTDQMTISRKDNYFMGFLKQSVMLLFKSETSCITGIKIVIKGRFNKAPRAKTRIIHFGKFSLQSFNSKIDYSKSTAYTINGTFGIKVWLCENDL